MTGFINTGISYLVYMMMILLHFTASEALAISYGVGMVSSYLLNAAWTFQKESWSPRQVGKFVLVNMVILFFSELMLRFILTHFTKSAYLGQAINLVPITLFGFLANLFFVFRDADSTMVADEFRISSQLKLRLFFVAVALVLLQRLLVLISAIHIAQKMHSGWTLYSLLIGGYTHWDSGWYIEIAQAGYTTKVRTAFWPLYPWLMARLHDISGTTYASCGIVISLCSFVAAVYFLGLLVRSYFGYSTTLAAMALFAFAPTSYYFDAVYTEALFLALSLAAVYASTANRFFMANLLVMFATLTRNTGIFLCIILFFDYLRWHQNGWKFWRIPWWKSIKWDAIWFVIPFVGLSSYCWWLDWKFGNPFAFLAAEKYWYRTYMPPWESFESNWNLLLHPNQGIASFEYLLFEVGMFIVALLFIVLGLRYIRKSPSLLGWWIYLLAVTWIASTEPSINIPDYQVSFPRYLLMLFPGIIFLADIIRPKWATLFVLILFGFVLFEKSGLFYTGQWIA